MEWGSYPRIRSIEDERLDMGIYVYDVYRHILTLEWNELASNPDNL